MKKHEEMENRRMYDLHDCADCSESLNMLEFAYIGPAVFGLTSCSVHTDIIYLCTICYSKRKAVIL